MSDIPVENYERQIRYELTRDIFVSKESRACKICNKEVFSTYFGKCMKCTRRLQWMAEDCFKEAERIFNTANNK